MVLRAGDWSPFFPVRELGEIPHPQRYECD
jgi:hypothetical protein